MVVKEFVEIVGVDVEEYGLNMLKVGVDLSKKIVEELIFFDVKEFIFGSKKVEIV